jgi:hypothetical protein
MMEIPYKFIVSIIILAVIVGVIVNFMFNTPKYKRVDEGFYGGAARGSGHPDCLRTLPEGSQILDALQSKGAQVATVEEGNADLAELQLILSKLGCLKKDLLSPSGIVDATRYQAFETAHDRQNVAEVCGMCLNQTIPARDLDIIFATWRDRGNLLLRRLCTAAQLKEAEVVHLEKLFKAAWEDVYDVSKSRCLKTKFAVQLPSDVGAFEPPALKDARQYDGYYSGWSGAV